MFITHSSLECFKSCRRKYKLRYIDCINPKQKSHSLEFGSAVHEMLEEYFTRIKADNAFSDSSGKLTCTKMLSHLFEKFDSIDKKYHFGAIDSAKLLSLVIGYSEHWFENDYSEYNVVEVEKEFNVKLDDQSTNFIGKVDGILQRKSDGKYYILEHKTASIVDDAYVQQKDIDAQTMTYALCIQKLLGIQISGCIHDILIKHKIRQKKGETESDFCDRIHADVTGDNFLRIPIEFSEEKLNEFKSELEASCNDLLTCKNFYKCTCNCLGRYGACEYMPICREGGLKEAIMDLYESNRPFEEISTNTILTVVEE